MRTFLERLLADLGPVERGAALAIVVIVLTGAGLAGLTLAVAYAGVQLTPAVEQLLRVGMALIALAVVDAMLGWLPSISLLSVLGLGFRIFRAAT